MHYISGAKVTLGKREPSVASSMHLHVKCTYGVIIESNNSHRPLQSNLLLFALSYTFGVRASKMQKQGNLPTILFLLCNIEDLVQL